MDRAVKYVKNVAVVLLSGLALLVVAGAVLAVAGTLTWSAFWDMALKALVVVGILFMANLIVAFLTGLLPQFSDKKK